MRLIEIPANPNCPAVDLRVFHDLGPPAPVAQVRLEREPDRPAWYDVAGWTSAGTPCPAMMQKVDDSGEGVAWLLFGGDAGLRLKPAGAAEAWRLTEIRQWGEPFLLLVDARDVRLKMLPDGVVAGRSDG